MNQDFFIVLSHKGREFNVAIQDPNSPIQDLIDRIITNLKLPRVDGGGNPAKYLLGRMHDNREEILQPRAGGEEKNLLDYNVKPGDRISLTIIPIAGYTTVSRNC